MNVPADCLGHALLEAYLADIGAGLPGPRRRRREILAELRDGLEQATTTRTAAGLDTEQAVTATIDEFGPARTIAGAFTAELTIAYARRVLGWFIVTGPLVGIWWLLLNPPPWSAGRSALLAAIPVIPLIAAAAVTAAATTAGTGQLMRWLPETSPVRALDAAITVAILAFAGDTIVMSSFAGSGRAVQPLAVIAIIASLTRVACSLIVMHHAVHLRRRVLAEHEVPPQRHPR